MNTVNLTGRIVFDPELKYTPSGVAVCELRIAVPNPFGAKDAQGRRPSEFFDLKAWRQQAEYAANFLAKGSLISLVGRLAIDEWIDKEGNKRRSYYVNVTGLQNWTSREEGTQGIAPDFAAAAAVGAPTKTDPGRGADPHEARDRALVASTSRTRARMTPQDLPDDPDFGPDPFADQ